jgi:two-component SAPR family response regulator
MNTILATKFEKPKPKPNLLLRERLLALVHNNLDKRLIAVISGAGYGKTTLIAQLLERERLPALFISLEPSDSDPAGFSQCLVTGLSRLAGAGQRSTLDQSLHCALEQMVHDASLAGNPVAFATALINELTVHRTEELFIVLDDYHWLESGSLVHAMVDFLVDRMPASLHLIITSRVPLPLPLMPKWRSKQDAFELDQSDLAFSDADLRALMEHVYRAALPDAELARVLEQTQGWITGIQLIMQAAGMHKSVKETLNGYVSANRPLFEYFASEIVAKEDDRTRTFLLQTSVLETMDGAACDHLLQRSGSARLLRELERRNVFITGTASQQYRYHPLFRTYLSDNIPDAGQKQALHSRAARYCQQSGQTDRAIDHFLQAGEFDRTAAVICAHLDKPGNATRFHTIWNWLSLLPQTVYDRHPRLLIQIIMWRKELGDFEGQQAAIDKALTLLRKIGDNKYLCEAIVQQGDALCADGKPAEALKVLSRGIRLCPSPSRETKGCLYNNAGIAASKLSDYQCAMRHYRKALEYMTDPFNRFITNCNIAGWHNSQGDFHQALRQFQFIFSQSKLDGCIYELGRASQGAVNCALYNGHIGIAEHFLDKAWKQYASFPGLVSTTSLQSSRGLLSLYKADWAGAATQLSEAEAGFQRINDQGNAALQHAFLCRLHRFRQQYSDARAKIDRIAAHGYFTGPPNDRNFIVHAFEKGMTETAQGQKTQARATARAIRSYTKTIGTTVGNFYADLILAAAGSADPGRARQHLQRAITASQRYGYDGILAAEIRYSPGLHQLFQRCRTTEQYREWLGSISGDVRGIAGQQMQHILFVKLFGQLEISSPSGQAIPIPWRTRKVAALMGYLAINRQRLCHREELIDALWPRSDVRKSKRRLYQTVCLLKDNLRTGFRSAGMPDLMEIDPLVHQNQSYRLSPQLNIELDTDHFETLWKEHIQFADPNHPSLVQHCQQALSLYRDGFMVAAGEAWSEEQRERFYKMQLMIIDKLGRRLQTLGQIEAAIMQYASYLKQEPFAEHVRIQYWRSLETTGQHQQVKKDYGVYLQFLRRELGQSPGIEVREFLQRLP